MISARAELAGKTGATLQMRSKLRLSFNVDDAGCVQPGARLLIPISATAAVPADVTYYRIRADSASLLPVRGCAGYLKEISRDGVPMMRADDVRLPFAPANAADTLAKRIRPDEPEYLDFLMISTNNHIVPCAYRDMGHNAVPWVELFKEPGQYRFHVVVTAGHTASSIEVLLTWTGDHKAVEIRAAT